MKITMFTHQRYVFFLDDDVGTRRKVDFLLTFNTDSRLEIKRNSDKLPTTIPTSSFVRSFVSSGVRPFVCSRIRSFVCSLYSFVRSFVRAHSFVIFPFSM